MHTGGAQRRRRTEEWLVTVEARRKGIFQIKQRQANCGAMHYVCCIRYHKSLAKRSLLRLSQPLALGHWS